MGLEGADSPLCVYPVHVGRDALVSHLPFFSHQFYVFLAALIVWDLEIHEEIIVLQSSYDDVVGVKVVEICLGHKGLDKDDVRGVVGNYVILVPTMSSGGEAACVVYVEHASMHCFYVEAMNAVVWWQDFAVVARRCRL